MLYEIRFKQVDKNGKVFEEVITATAVEMATRNGLDAVKVMPNGKNRWKWFEVPNDFQMEKYVSSFEITISEATTGKNVYKITR